jgi:hypothetical protein
VLQHHDENASPGSRNGEHPAMPSGRSETIAPIVSYVTRRIPRPLQGRGQSPNVIGGGEQMAAVMADSNRQRLPQPRGPLLAVTGLGRLRHYCRRLRQVLLQTSALVEVHEIGNI